MAVEEAYGAHGEDGDGLDGKFEKKRKGVGEERIFWRETPGVSDGFEDACGNEQEKYKQIGNGGFENRGDEIIGAEHREVLSYGGGEDGDGEEKQAEEEEDI